ncbi:sialidase family protein [Aquimarina sp. I32.4]|uniref:WD40/YVTN/BNR-like repeat-containing protein n=1 Tax=Aquimarina sp. I32.4 TaxID=2053903 RepID=UPI000CDF2534|nr:sialidase family protein [Aquimarina sp. I32.4]
MNNKFIIASLAILFCINLQAQEIVLKGKELFGNLKARQIGPALMSGRIIDLENHPTNDRIIYAGTAGGGVWKSSNGGASFSSVFDKHAQSIGVVKVDPTDPDTTIWVGTGEIWTRNSVSIGDGLYKSTDGGANWKKMGFENSERISSIQINPKNSNEIYIGVLGALWSDSSDRGVYKTIDGGKTWNKILYINQKTGANEVIIDPKNPNIVYAAMWEFRRTPWGFNSGGPNSALYKSTDAGKTWNKIHNGFPKGDLGRLALAISPSNPQIIYTVIESKENKGLYRSDDAGANWKLLNGDFGLVVRPFYFSRIVVDPKNPDILIKGGLFGSISRDGGKTFKNLGSMHADIHDIVFDINNSDRIYVGTDGGVYRSWDGGATMDMVDNLPISQFYHISVDNEEPYNIYGGLQDNGSWWGPSSSPGGIEARDWKPVGYGDGFRVLRHPSKKIIYSEMQGAQNVWRYDIDRNYTKNIKPLPIKGEAELRFNWNAPMAVSNHYPDRFYMGSQFLHISEDMGDNWKKISPDLTTNDPAKQDKESGGLSVDKSGAETHTTIFTIAESPIDQNIIWVGTDDGNVQVTQDGGKSWTNTVANIQGLPKNTWVYHIEASTHNKETAYAVFDGHTTGDMKPYVYKTTDFGKTWSSLVTNDIVGFARNIQEDYVNQDILYLGTEFGLFITIDGGKHWSRFTNNMPATAVHFIDLQKKTNDLVLGTHGRGIIIIDDISPLRKITQEVLTKNIHFFENPPFTIKEESGFGGGSTKLQFKGENPNTNAKIIYYLKKRHTFGKMTLSIQDQNGNKVVDLVPGKSKGINIVNWNFRKKAPKVAAGKTLTFGGFTAPRVAAGTYNIVLTKGKNQYKSTITLQNDPISLVSEKDRIVQRKAAQQLFDDMQELAYLVYQIDQNIQSAKNVSKKDSASQKITSSVINELVALKKTLVVTTGDNYVAEAEPQLREKLSEVYSDVTNLFEKPSSAQLENKEVLETRLHNAKEAYKNIENKQITKLNKYLEKTGGTPLKIITKEEFINK